MARLKSTMTVNPARFVRSHAPLVSPPECPDFRLHMADPASRLSRLADADDEGGPAAPPYWAFAWAGGLALARHIRERPTIVAGRRVLDLGAGSGIVAIAAARAGAAKVFAAEVDRFARAAIALNAVANDVAVSLLAGDITRGGPPPVELVLAGDVFYDRELAGRMMAFLTRCGAGGVDVLVGDPGRAYLPRADLRLLAEYKVRDVGDDGRGATGCGAVFALRTAISRRCAPPAGTGP